MANVRGGLVHYWGQCRDCDFTVSSRNAVGLASQHAQRYKHQVWVETGHHYEITADGIAPTMEDTRG